MRLKELLEKREQARAEYEDSIKQVNDECTLLAERKLCFKLMDIEHRLNYREKEYIVTRVEYSNVFRNVVSVRLDGKRVKTSGESYKNSQFIGYFHLLLDEEPKAFEDGLVQ